MKPEELVEKTENFGFSKNGRANEIRKEARNYASDYDYDSDTLDAEEAVVDAYIAGMRMALYKLGYIKEE